MTTERDDESWRTHEVPTFTQAEDTWIAGLTARQLLGLVLAATLGYVVYQFSPLWFLPGLARIAAGLTVGLVIAGFVAIKPGGRTMFAIIGEYVAFRFGPRYHVSEVRRLVATRAMEQYRGRRRRRGMSFSLPLPLPGRIVRLDIRIPLPFSAGRGGGAAMLLLLLSGGILAAACGADRAQAQVADDYRGRRVYLQSIVTKLSGSINDGAQSATIRLRAAAPLKEAGPRLNETLQSVTELQSHGTRVLPAWTKVGSGGPIGTAQALTAGQEFVFENVYLGDSGSQLGTDDIRPYCDIAMGEGQYVQLSSPPRISYRAHSKDCRIRSQGGNVDQVEGLTARDAISKPVLSVNWQDRKRNQGALTIGVGMLPYPAQAVIGVTPVGRLADGEAELLDRHEICDGRLVKIVSLGIQSERPADPGAEDYFEGESGQRISGVVKTCPLVALTNVEVILPETVVFAAGESDFEIKVRPVVGTLQPLNIVSRATLVVLDREGTAELATLNVPKPGDTGFDPLNPDTVKFNIAPPALEEKRSSADPDSAIIQLRVDLEHRVTVKRPVYQPIERFNEHGVQHIYRCGCLKSGGTCSPGGSCSCSCTSEQTRRYFKYWDPHYRVDAEDKEYLPNAVDSDIELVFEQSFLFEKMLVTFDRPYEELLYVDPTPEPGEVREPDYYEEGRVIGLWDGEPLHCGPGVAQDAEGRWTGWLWIAPGVNSEGEAYGGCRRSFACKLNIPEQEGPFGPGGTPTEEDYECVNR